MLAHSHVLKELFRESENGDSFRGRVLADDAVDSVTADDYLATGKRKVEQERKKKQNERC